MINTKIFITNIRDKKNFSISKRRHGKISILFKIVHSHKKNGHLIIFVQLREVFRENLTVPSGNLWPED